MTETDRNLNNRIRTGLKADSSLSDASQTVSFSSDNGTVTLNGTVATEKEKKDLESRLRGMAGVNRVENNLQIAPRTSSSTSSSNSPLTSPSALRTSGGMANGQALTESDRNLNTQIWSAFKTDPSLRDVTSGVSIRTDDGVVALNGSVATEQEKAELESRIERMTGVKEVENNLQIVQRTGSGSSSSMSDTTAAR